MARRATVSPRSSNDQSAKGTTISSRSKTIAKPKVKPSVSKSPVKSVHLTQSSEQRRGLQEVIIHKTPTTSRAGRDNSVKSNGCKECCAWIHEECSFKVVLQLFISFLIGIGGVTGYLHGKFEISGWFSVGSGLLSGAVLFLLMHYSRRARCTLLICIPEAASFTGRFLLALFAGWIITQYPIENIIGNSKELTRLGTCTAQHVIVQGQIMKAHVLQMQDQMISNMIEHYDRLIEPINSTMLTIDRHLTNIENTIQPVTDSIEWLNNNCRGELGRVDETCKNVSAMAYGSCQSLPAMQSAFTSWICKPSQWAVSTCRGVDPQSFCYVIEPLRFVTNSIPAMREELRKLRKSLAIEIEHSKNVSMDHDVDEKMEMVQSGITKQIKENVTTATETLAIIHCVLFILPWLILPIKSYLFLRKVLKRLDKGRLLRKPEKDYPVAVNQKRVKVIMFCKIFLVLLKLFIAGVVFLTEYGFHQFVLVTRENSNVQFQFDGVIYFQASLKSSGLPSQMLEILTPKINISNAYHNSINLQQCLPTPVPLSPVFAYICIGILYSALLIIAWLSDGILDYRYDLVSYFYREKITAVEEYRARRRR